MNTFCPNSVLMFVKHLFTLHEGASIDAELLRLIYTHSIIWIHLQKPIIRNEFRV